MVVICVILLSTVLVGNPVSAASNYTTYSYKEWEVDRVDTGEIYSISLSLPDSVLGAFITEGGVSYPQPDISELTYIEEYDTYPYVVPNPGEPAAVTVYYPGCRVNKILMECDNIPDGSTLRFGGELWCGDPSGFGAYTFTVQVWPILCYFDAEYKSISNVKGTSLTKEYLDSGNNEYQCFYDFTMEVDKPTNAKYIGCAVNMRIDCSSSYRNRVVYYEWWPNNQVMLSIPITAYQENQIGGVVGGMEDSGDKLGDFADDVQTSKPPTDDVDLNGITPNQGISNIAVTIEPIINNELVVKVMVMVATLMLVSYVLFGKKGG